MCNIVLDFINDYQFKKLGNLLFYLKFDLNTFLESERYINSILSAKKGILKPDPGKMFLSLNIDFNIPPNTVMNKTNDSTLYKKFAIDKIVLRDQLNSVRQYFFDHHFMEIWILLSLYLFDLSSFENIIMNETPHFFEPKSLIIAAFFEYYKILRDSFFTKYNF